MTWRPVPHDPPPHCSVDVGRRLQELTSNDMFVDSRVSSPVQQKATTCSHGRNQSCVLRESIVQNSQCGGVDTSQDDDHLTVCIVSCLYVHSHAIEEDPMGHMVVLGMALGTRMVPRY